MPQCPAELELENAILYCCKEEDHAGPHRPDKDAIRRELPSGGSLHWTEGGSPKEKR